MRMFFGSIKVAHNDARRLAALFFFLLPFYFVFEKYFFSSFDGDRMSSSGPQIFVKLSHMIK